MYTMPRAEKPSPIIISSLLSYLSARTPAGTLKRRVGRNASKVTSPILAALPVCLTTYTLRPKLVSHAYDGHTLTITFDQPLKETTLQVNARTSKGMIKVSLKARNEQLICTVDDLVSITYGDEDYFTDYIVGINDIPISPFTITI